MRRPSRVVPWVALVAGILAGAIVGSPAPAQAKARFGLQLQLGLEVPLNDYVTRVSLIREEDLGEDPTSIPYIGDYSNTAGAGWAFVVIYRQIELSVRNSAFPWGETTLTHKGDRPARFINDRQIDDGGAEYEELESPQTVTDDALTPTGPALSVLMIDVGYRYYPLEEDQYAVFGDWFEIYTPVGGGLAFAKVTPGSDSTIGIHLWGGLAADFQLGNWAFVFDTRYNILVTERAQGIPQGSANATRTDSSVFGALISQMHFVSTFLGLRYAFN